jgi:hypothetical protein
LFCAKHNKNFLEKAHPHMLGRNFFVRNFTPKEYSVTIFTFKIKIFPKNLEILFWENFLPHLDSAFSLVAVFFLFRQVLKICCHLLLNPSCYASPPMMPHLKFEKNIHWMGLLPVTKRPDLSISR